MRRWIAMKFCDMTKREVEYVALNRYWYYYLVNGLYNIIFLRCRDTTEADLKQRREISKYPN